MPRIPTAVNLKRLARPAAMVSLAVLLFAPCAQAATIELQTGALVTGSSDVPFAAGTTARILLNYNGGTGDLNPSATTGFHAEPVQSMTFDYSSGDFVAWPSASDTYGEIHDNTSAGPDADTVNIRSNYFTLFSPGWLMASFSIKWSLDPAILNSDAVPDLASLTAGGNSPLVTLAFFSVNTGQYTTYTANATVAATTPVPAALPFFASALGGLGIFGWRRRKREQAPA